MSLSRGLALGLVLCVSVPWPARAQDRRALRELEAAILRADAFAPRYDPPTSSELSALLARLQAVARDRQVAVVMASVDELDAAGRTSRDRRTIYLSASLGVDAQAQVLAHELAHALGPPLYDEAAAEVFADAVSYLVMRRAGVDPLGTYAQYLVGYRWAVGVLRLYEREIVRTADVLASRAR